MDLYFSQYFQVDPAILRDYGAFDISVVSDLPLFVDPFLLFNSDNPAYQELHASIVRYLVFLRDQAKEGLDQGLIDNWYRFKEVKQNWLGFTLLGNGGHGLGREFAVALHESLSKVLTNFGAEAITRGTHLEKLCLVKPGVGRDTISDFTTNLIKHFLCTYTEAFAKAHLAETCCTEVPVARARFNYETESWETRRYWLPVRAGDFLLLTPADMLTRDETWINYADMVNRFDLLPTALPDDQLRSQVNHYFRSLLSRRATADERRSAAARTIAQFPELIDYYIRLKEEDGDGATTVSAQRVAETKRVLVDQLKQVLADLDIKTKFYDMPWSSYDEALERVHMFKHYVEDQDGYRLINRDGKAFSDEKEVQLFFGLIWCRTDFDVNREPNNGRGPVDFKVSYGSADKSLIEFKLASNRSLPRNLEKQVAVYEKANDTRTSVKVIVCYTAADQLKVVKTIAALKLENEESIVVIDARSDNKPSGSKA